MGAAGLLGGVIGMVTAYRYHTQETLDNDDFNDVSDMNPKEISQIMTDDFGSQILVKSSIQIS